MHATAGISDLIEIIEGTVAAREDIVCTHQSPGLVVPKTDGDGIRAKA
jgi:hypothetical protein